jgi:hypothetical protein
MRRHIFTLTVAVFCLASLPAQALSILDQFHRMVGPIKGPIDSLYFDLGSFQLNCFLVFSLERATPTKEGLTTAQECVERRLAEGNDSILKIRANLQTPAAQTALKELAFYWRTQMANVSSPVPTVNHIRPY